MYLNWDMKVYTKQVNHSLECWSRGFLEGLRQIYPLINLDSFSGAAENGQIAALRGTSSDVDRTFESALRTWDWFYKNLGAGSLETGLVQVCYGGVFAASFKNIKKRKMEVWRAAEQSLSRGNNIQEGHYMERTWATLVALPLEEYEVEALKNNSDFLFRPGSGGNEPFLGMLVRKQ
jgi:hypothetical protein